MSEYKQKGNDLNQVESKRRRSRSLFGPILLIAIGIVFLLNNLGWLPGTNWAGVLRFWPVLFIFIGIGILVQQIRPPWGTMLTGLTALAAVGFFGFMLFLGGDTLLNEQFGLASGESSWQVENIDIALNDAIRADIMIDFSSRAALLRELDEPGSILAGTVSYGDELLLNERVEGDQAIVRLDTRDNNSFLWLIPGNLSGDDETAQAGKWQLGLNPNVPTALSLDIGSGSVDLSLADTQLSELAIDGGSGSLNAQLPGGNYDLHYDAGSGSARIALPDSGMHQVEIDGSSGSIQLLLPPTIEARVRVDDGSGSFDLPQDRFRQLSGDQPDDGVWATAGFDQAADRIDMILDIGSGSVQILEP